MASTYAKPHLTIPQQLAQLAQRGLVIANQNSAQDWLRRVGYYRLSAYWYPFRQRQIVQVAHNRLASVVQDQFVAGASFDDAVSLYAFDQTLRVLALEALEAIEVAVRVDVAHYLGGLNTFAQEDPSLLDAKFTRNNPSAHQDWLTKLGDCVARSKEEFVTHFKTRYGTPLPIWVSIEVWDFGLLSKFYAGMAYKHQEIISSRCGVARPDVMVSWLRTLNFVRNVVAHHCRLWNRNMIDQPRKPAVGQIADFDAFGNAWDPSRLYSALCIMSYLLRTYCPGSTWPARLSNHLESFPAIALPRINVSDMGCQAGWRAHPFW